MELDRASSDCAHGCHATHEEFPSALDLLEFMAGRANLSRAFLQNRLAAYAYEIRRS